MADVAFEIQAETSHLTVATMLLSVCYSLLMFAEGVDVVYSLHGLFYFLAYMDSFFFLVYMDSLLIAYIGSLLIV